ncbi:MAG: glycosyltransferase [Bryobacterales bacterium]|nr:glycosyltransferase [Bryobacterales bacterium]MBV9396743.1 glycosyltransferase [Bryobacterales bacterium]
MASNASAPVVTFSSEQIEHTTERIRYWDAYIRKPGPWAVTRRYYQRRLAEIYGSFIPPGLRVLELGCGTGDLLAALRPARGLGIDFSQAAIKLAGQKHPDIEFRHADAHAFECDETFDAIICSDLVNELWDVQRVLSLARRLSHPGTRVILNSYSRLWEIPRRAAEKLMLVQPQLAQNWLTVEDLSNLLYLSDFEVIRASSEIMWPVRTPAWDRFCNRYLVKLWPFRWFGITNFVIARPRPQPVDPEPVVSVVVPARNESGNISAVFDRLPQMGAGTELIFVEGHSKDDTYETIVREMQIRQRPRTKLFRQTGKGKGDAVRLGFANASGNLLMILDADLTVPPEDLPRFYDAWRSGQGEFINGVRLVYPMQKRAMRFFNTVGNKFFSLAFTWLLGQSIKDTLCGTKVLSRADYEKIAANRAYFGEIDPFGDFDLIFGAARLNLRIVDLPIRYRERTYGETNIQRWSHGALLLKMVTLAMRKIKFL